MLHLDIVLDFSSTIISVQCYLGAYLIYCKSTEGFYIVNNIDTHDPTCS